MRKIPSLFSLALLLALPLGTHAQLVVNDTLTGATSSYGWKPQGGACLTAGSNAAGSTLPACVGLSAYSGQTQVGGTSGRLPDQVGSGALRLTNGDTKVGTNGNSMTGSVVSTTPFPTSQGVQVTFSTVTYGGNAYVNSANAKSGADGMAFFLMDGSRPPSTGAFGGSLGYSCANGKGDQNTPDGANGVDGGYLGVGIDEFGNFSNPSDSTSDGPGQSPGSIVVRGAGSITYARLNALNSTYYPSSNLPGTLDNTTKAAARVLAVQKTCSTGKLWNYSGAQIVDKNNNKIKSGTATTETVLDYPLLVSKPVTDTIYSQEATSMPLRKAATVLTYNLKITQDGLLSLSYSSNGGASNTIFSNQSITAGNGPLPSSFLFGFTAGTGGGSNVHEITCFKAAPINAAADSAGSNVPQAATLQAGTQVYLASYHPLNYWGQLTASYFVADSLGNLSVNPVPNWDASCVLTGGVCSSTGATTTAQTSASRRILSYSTTGIDFLKLSDLTSAQQSAIGGSTDGTNRINYLRGDRSKEIVAGGSGTFRHRDGVLGDIRASSPTWVGPPTLPYTSAGTDLLTKLAIAEFGTTYNAFATTYQSRPQIVYVGANDGMLHGFRAGANTGAGAYDASNNDGKELLAYVPTAVVSSIHPSNANYDFSSSQYAHNAYVDATAAMGDLYYAGAWHTWLVGGLGAGGSATGELTTGTAKAAAAVASAIAGSTVAAVPLTSSGSIYALDITDPANFATTAASSLVIGELNAGTISCANDSACGTKFGAVYGTPIIRRTHDGNWAVIFGNGRNSATGAAGVFIATVDRTTGAVTTRYLDTGSTNAVTKNGIDYVVSADLDSDHVIDYLYAGDTAGHIWRFDLTSSTPSDWLASSALSLVFTTPAGQPISTALTINRITQSNSLPRIVIGFGTGRQEPQTPSADASYAAGQQYLYGIWDWNLAAWNAKGSAQYTVLSTTPATVTTGNLASQVVSGGVSNGVSYRTAASIVVCWSGSVSCGADAAKNAQFGWMMPLPASGEQLIYSPTAQFNTFFANTTIPAVNQALSCIIQPASGYSMAVTIVSGSSNGTLTTAAKNLGITDAAVAASVVGIAYNATGTSSFITTGSGNNAKTYMYGQTISGTYFGTKIDRDNTRGGKRLTWVKLK
jgi:type IV pilus assembly protein PilY1